MVDNLALPTFTLGLEDVTKAPPSPGKASLLLWGWGVRHDMAVSTLTTHAHSGHRWVPTTLGISPHPPCSVTRC